MVENATHAIAVQKRRKAAGLSGRSKAVRRWFKRAHGVSIDACAGVHICTSAGAMRPFHTDKLEGDFSRCRSCCESRLGQYRGEVSQ